MARFRFRLEKVLTVRADEERREKMRFAERVREKAVVEAEIAELEARMETALDSAATISTVGGTLDQLVQSYDYRVGLMRKRGNAEKKLEQTNLRFEEARLRLVEARRKRRVLEMLREQHYKEWKLEEAKREQAELDEIGINGFVRTMGQPGGREVIV